MSKKEKAQALLEDMARFYLKNLFYSIPYVTVKYSDDMDGSLGKFGLEKASDYDPDNDELLGTYGYRWKYIPFENELGGIDIGIDESWSDPINHPDVTILINYKLVDNTRMLVGTLLHELLHYYYWYIGRDYHDNDYDFLEKCKEMELPTNYTDWEWKDKKWVETFDYSKIDKYIQMYADRQQEAQIAA